MNQDDDFILPCKYDTNFPTLQRYTWHGLDMCKRCYCDDLGSKGFDKNGRTVRSFVPNDCDAEMTHCFGSYTDDFSQITASCQSLNTEQQLLDVCKVRMSTRHPSFSMHATRQHSHLHVKNSML
uniref:Uncharacterized protein n=1 Tax=Angiostrongylus cantonensis TaxID=6313 RepID=A0A0K0DHN5_ANGCA